MEEHFKIQTWDLMKERARDVDAFFAVSRYFASYMQPLLAIPEEKLFVHHITIDPADYTYQNSSEKPLNIGYISRMCEENGLDILVDAFILLKKDKQWDKVNLIVTGGSTGENSKFVKSIRRKISKSGLESEIEFHQDFEDGRHEFFKKVSMISVPVLDGEAFGMYLLESMASGVPVVQPALGAFPEIVKKSGGGIIYEPNTPEALAKTLSDILADQEKINKLSALGRKGVEDKFNVQQEAKDVVARYSQLIN